MGKLLDRRGAGLLLNGYNPTDPDWPAGVCGDTADLSYLKWGGIYFPPYSYSKQPYFSGKKVEDPTKTDGAWFPTATKDRCFKKKGEGPIFIYFRLKVEYTMEFWGQGIFGQDGAGLYLGSRNPDFWSFGSAPPWPSGRDYVAISNAEAIGFSYANYDPTTGLPTSYVWDVTSQSVTNDGEVTTSYSTQTQLPAWRPSMAGYTAWYGGSLGYYYKESGSEIHSSDLTFRTGWGTDEYSPEPFNILLRDAADSDVPAYNLTEPSDLVVYPSLLAPSWPTRFVAYTTDVTDYSYLRTKHKTRFTLQAVVQAPSGTGTPAYSPDCDCWFKDKTYNIKVKWQEGECNVTQTGTGYSPLYEQLSWTDEHTESLSKKIDVSTAPYDPAWTRRVVDLWTDGWAMDAGKARRLLDVWVESIE